MCNPVKFPNMLGFEEEKIKIKELKTNQWHSFESDIFDYDGFLVKKEEDNCLLITHYWDKGFEFNSETKELVGTNIKGLTFRIYEDDKVCFVRIHPDVLLFLPRLADRDWEDIEVTTLYVDFFQNNTLSESSIIPSKYEHIATFETLQNEEAYISDQDMINLYTQYNS